MNQYLLIFLWVLFLGAFNRRQYQNEKWLKVETNKSSALYFLSLTFPIVISAALRTTFGDQGYKIVYRANNWSFSQLIEMLQGGAKGPSFYILQFLGMKTVGNNAELFYFIIAAIQMYSIVRIYRKYSVDAWLGVFVFVASTDYMSWMQNGIRQFVAVTFILFFSEWIFQKKTIKFFIVVLIAATFHSSALIMIPIYFAIQGRAFNLKMIFATGGTIVLVALLNHVVPILETVLSGTEYRGVIYDWQSSGNDGVNVLRVLVYSVPTIMAFLGRKRILCSGEHLIHIVCNMSIMTTLLYIVGMFTSGIYIGRLPIYCSLYSNGILLPWLLNSIFTSDTKKILYMALIVLFAVFYYFQMHMVWGIM